MSLDCVLHFLRVRDGAWRAVCCRDVMQAKKQKEHWLTSRFLLEACLIFYENINARHVRRQLASIFSASVLASAASQEARGVAPWTLGVQCASIGLVANAFAPCVLKKGMPNLGPRKTTGCVFLGSSKFWFSFFPVKLQNWGTNSKRDMHDYRRGEAEMRLFYGSTHIYYLGAPDRGYQTGS